MTSGGAALPLPGNLTATLVSSRGLSLGASLIGVPVRVDRLIRYAYATADAVATVDAVTVVPLADGDLPTQYYGLLCPVCTGSGYDDRPTTPDVVCGKCHGAGHLGLVADAAVHLLLVHVALAAVLGLA